jgi:GNAT superfamily N-acetyltransferase
MQAKRQKSDSPSTTATPTPSTKGASSVSVPLTTPSTKGASSVSVPLTTPSTKGASSVSVPLTTPSTKGASTAIVPLAAEASSASTTHEIPIQQGLRNLRFEETADRLRAEIDYTNWRSLSQHLNRTIRAAEPVRVQLQAGWFELEIRERDQQAGTSAGYRLVPIEEPEDGEEEQPPWDFEVFCEALHNGWGAEVTVPLQAMMPTVSTTATPTPSKSMPTAIVALYAEASSAPTTPTPTPSKSTPTLIVPQVVGASAATHAEALACYKSICSAMLGRNASAPSWDDAVLTSMYQKLQDMHLQAGLCVAGSSGCAAGEIVANSKTRPGHLKIIAILATARGMGHGAKLLEALIAECKSKAPNIQSACVDVSKCQAPSRRFWKGQGFTEKSGKSQDVWHLQYR